MGKFIPKHFATTLEQFAREVTPKEVYNMHGWKALRKMDQRILEFLDEFRFDVDVPLTINTWFWGGTFNQSGMRTVGFYKSQEDMDKSLSDHITGRALDIKSSHLSGHELRMKFIEKEDYYYNKYGINFIETAPLSNGSSMEWFHVGIRVDIDGEVLYWSPKLGFIDKQKVIDKKL